MNERRSLLSRGLRVPICLDASLSFLPKSRRCSRFFIIIDLTAWLRGWNVRVNMNAIRVFLIDRFVGHGGGPLERQKQDSHVYRKTGTWSLIFLKNQSCHYINGLSSWPKSWKLTLKMLSSLVFTIYRKWSNFLNSAIICEKGDRSSSSKVLFWKIFECFLLWKRSFF